MFGAIAGKMAALLAAVTALFFLQASDVAARPPGEVGEPTEQSVQQDRRDRMNEFASMLGEIGEEATRLVGSDPDGLFLYAEVQEGKVSVFLFRNEAKAVRWYLDSAIDATRPGALGS